LKPEHVEEHTATSKTRNQLATATHESPDESALPFPRSGADRSIWTSMEIDSTTNFPAEADSKASSQTNNHQGDREEYQSLVSLLHIDPETTALHILLLQRLLSLLQFLRCWPSGIGNVGLALALQQARLALATLGALGSKGLDVGVVGRVVDHVYILLRLGRQIRMGRSVIVEGGVWRYLGGLLVVTGGRLGRSH